MALNVMCYFLRHVVQSKLYVGYKPKIKQNWATFTIITIIDEYNTR